MQERINPIPRDYPLVVPAIRGKDRTFATTLPRLSPLPGNTPTGVSARGTFLMPSNQAKVLHSLPPDADITR